MSVKLDENGVQKLKKRKRVGTPQNLYQPVLPASQLVKLKARANFHRRMAQIYTDVFARIEHDKTAELIEETVKIFQKE